MASACGHGLVLGPERMHRCQCPVLPLLSHKSPEEHLAGSVRKRCGREAEAPLSCSVSHPTAWLATDGEAWPRQAPGEAAVTPESGRAAEVSGVASDSWLGGRVASAKFTFSLFLVSFLFGKLLELHRRGVDQVLSI